MNLSDKINYIKQSIIFIQGKYIKLSFLIEEQENDLIDYGVQLQRICDNIPKEVQALVVDINSELASRHNLAGLNPWHIVYILPVFVILCTIQAARHKKSIKNYENNIITLKDEIEIKSKAL